MAIFQKAKENIYPSGTSIYYILSQTRNKSDPSQISMAAKSTYKYDRSENENNCRRTKRIQSKQSYSAELPYKHLFQFETI